MNCSGWQQNFVVIKCDLKVIDDSKIVANEILFLLNPLITICLEGKRDKNIPLLRKYALA